MWPYTVTLLEADVLETFRAEDDIFFEIGASYFAYIAINGLSSPPSLFKLDEVECGHLPGISCRV
jgi:hypothetical protein